MMSGYEDNSASALELAPYFKGILYGEFGAGKTVTSCSVIEASDDSKYAMLVAVDSGWVSLKNPAHKHFAERILVEPYKGTKQLKVISEAALTKEFTDKYGLIIVDTASQIYERYVDYLLDSYNYPGTRFREKAVLRQGMKSDAEADLTQTEIPGKPDYHLARNTLRPIIANLMQAECDVILTAHVREPYADAAELDVRPNMAHSIYLLMGREVHALGYLKKDGSKRTISFRQEKRIIVKSRLADLDGKIIDQAELAPIVKEWKKNV